MELPPSPDHPREQLESKDTARPGFALDLEPKTGGPIMVPPRVENTGREPLYSRSLGSDQPATTGVPIPTTLPTMPPTVPEARAEPEAITEVSIASNDREEPRITSAASLAVENAVGSSPRSENGHDGQYDDAQNLAEAASERRSLPGGGSPPEQPPKAPPVSPAGDDPEGAGDGAASEPNEASRTPEPLSPAEVRARCQEEARQAVAIGLEQLLQPSETGESTTYGVGSVSAVIADLALEAADSNDLDQFEAHLGNLDAISELSPDSKHVIDKVCLAGVEIGSQRASEMLQHTLEADVQRDSQSQEAYVQDWKEARDHYAQQHRQAPEVSAHVERLESLASELLEPDKFTPASVIYETYDTLREISNPALRLRLLSNFVEAVEGNPPFDTEMFRNLVRVGATIASDPDLADPEVLEPFDRGINAYAQALEEQVGVSRFALAEYRLPWKVALARSWDESPSAVVDELNEQTRQLSEIAKESKDKASRAVRQNIIAALRDDMLEEYAVEYAQQGHFSSAQYFAASMESEPRREFVVERCLSLANHIEQVWPFKPDDETVLNYSPGLRTHIGFAEARLTQGPDRLNRLESFAREFAATINEVGEMRGDQLLRQGHIKDAYRAIAKSDTERGLALAKDLLGTLRGKGLPYHASVVEYLSRELIQAGDTDEPARAYADLTSQPLDPSQRLRALWQLAKALQ